MARAPETSGSRVALEVAGAMLQVVHSGADNAGDNEVHRDRVHTMQRLATIARGCKQLQSYQIDEVLEHVSGMVGVSNMMVGVPEPRDVGSGESGTGEGQ